MALILDVTRRITEGDRLVRSGAAWSWGMNFMLGSGLSGRRLGIVGMGLIGTAVATRAAAFGMQVVYASRRSNPGSKPWDGVSFRELIRTSDVVSLHCPLTPATRHLIGDDELSSMKPGAYLVNTARGPLVDEAALVEALKDGRIAGAALDVYENEPSVHPALRSLDNVVLAPHLGSATWETRRAMITLAAANVEAVLRGKPAITPIPAA
jgi:glyoxylate reductase